MDVDCEAMLHVVFMVVWMDALSSGYLAGQGEFVYMKLAIVKEMAFWRFL